MSSYINRVNPDTAIMSAVALKYAVYFFLISNTFEHDDDVVYSEYTEDTLARKFRHYTEDEIEEAIKDLATEGLITVVYEKPERINYYGVGVTTSDGISKLYSHETVTADDSIKCVHEAILSYVEDASGISSLRAKRLKAEFESLCSIPPVKFTHKEFVKLYCYAYEALFQEEPREFMQREHGQLKQLRKLYAPVMLYKMIVQYLANSQKYAKDVNFGILVYKKDKVYLDIKGKVKSVGSKSHMRTRKEEDF